MQQIHNLVLVAVQLGDVRRQLVRQGKQSRTQVHDDGGHAGHNIRLAVKLTVPHLVLGFSSDPLFLGQLRPLFVEISLAALVAPQVVDVPPDAGTQIV